MSIHFSAFFLALSATLSAASISGFIHDSSGKPVADVKVSFYDPDQPGRQETASGADGKFTVSSNGPGLYLLRAEKPEFATLFRAYALSADARIKREYTLVAAGSASVPDKVPGQSSEPQRVRIGAMVLEAMLRLPPTYSPTGHKAACGAASYPAAAKRAKISGSPRIRVFISKDGAPFELRLVSSNNDDLSEAAITCARVLAYKPFQMNGVPVEIDGDVVLNYVM
jgi:TonB family protein